MLCPIAGVSGAKSTDGDPSGTNLLRNLLSFAFKTALKRLTNEQVVSDFLLD